MGIAKFTADVTTVAKKAAAGAIPSITSVVSGTVHGQLVITISHKSLSKDVKIRATCEDPAEYPDETAFSLSVPHGTPSHVADALKSTQDFLVGMRLYEVALALSTSLQAASDSEEEHHDEAAEDSDDGEYDDWSDGEFGIPGSAAPGSSRDPSPKSQRMRSDLRQVRNSGYKVGFLSDIAKAGNGGTVSISIRINKLELSQDLMEAWDVEPTDYFVLLIRFGSSYTTLDTIVERPADGVRVSFCVGKCSSYKPSPEQAALAFLQETDRRSSSEAREPTEGPETSAVTGPDTAFRKLFLSNSLDQYLNQNLIRLIKIRNRDGCTWDAANETHRQQYASTQGNPRTGPNASLPGPGRPPSFPRAAHLLGQDHWGDVGRQGSFPLVAMQFAMRNFMKCNSFCLVCHRPVDDDEIEALRPYVCSDSLCLFQYLSMGFGPSIEHEIITQPLVVDLLVSLCYAALIPKYGDSMLASSQGPPTLRDLPVGLQLRVPNIFSSMVKALRGEVEHLSNVDSPIPPNPDGRFSGTLLVAPTSLSPGTKLHIGQWIAFQRATDITLHHAQIKDIVGQRIYVEVAASSIISRPADLSHLPTAGVQYAMNRTGASATGASATYGAPRTSGGDPNDVEIFFYDADFDSLKDVNMKIEAMRLILDTLPSIQDMAAYLRNNPGCTLRTMPKVTPAASSLLAWIISSNRSCIYQIDRSLPKLYNGPTKTPSTVQASGQPKGQTGGQPQGQASGQQYPGADTAAALSLPPSPSADEAMVCGRDREQERIGGMDGWVQFRFAQGSPDKELRFKQALQAEASLTGDKRCPTLLAWHGSPVSNWHSILRTGLNFETIANGRSFGNGVYFSPHYQTSHGYCGNRPVLRWKNSELAAQSCVSLNEIINVPEKWASFTPHYVVAQPDWHQCRYLFVERTVVPGSEAALMKSAPTPTDSKARSKLFPQDKGWEIRGPGSVPLTVPLSAIPTGRKLQTKPTSHSKRKAPKSLSSDEEEEDRALLLSDSEEHGVDSSYRSGKRRSLSLASNSSVSQHRDALEAGPRKGASSAQLTRPLVTVEKKMTDFVPDSLNLATLPRLAEPSFSNNMALRALGRELSKLQSIQTKTPLHELGWYLHAEAVTNLFQWIVELHSFDASLPLAQDMRKLGMTSIVLEIRFPGDFPMSPPFVRVVRPRFLPFTMGGGGHVTGGGAMCMELLTSTGWSPAYSMESVLLQVRLAMTNLEPRPGRVWDAVQGYSARSGDYGVSEAIEAYQRAVQAHGWKAPANLVTTAHGA